MIDIDEILRPPTEAEVERAISMFADAVRAHYGERLKGLYLFGSRARGDHKPDSDADIAVVLHGLESASAEKMPLTDLAYDVIVETGVHVQAWPVSETHWNDPAMHTNPPLVRNMRADGREIE